MTLIVLVGIDPATAYLPSGVTYTLWIAPFTGMLFTLVSKAVSITSTAPGACAIAHIDVRAVFGHGHVVRPAAQRNPLGDLQRLRIHHVQRAQRFVGDVDPPPVRRDRDAVRNLDILDGPDHLIGGGVDHVNVVSGRVGL